MVDFVVVVDAKRTSKAQSRVKVRVGAGLCVMCESDAGPIGPRGLCDHCRHLYRSKKQGLTQEEQARYEAKLIRTGRILRGHEIRQLKRRHFLDQLVAEIKAEK